MKIAPSILSADFTNLKRQIKICEPVTDILHYDVMDGSFVPNISFGPKILKDIKKITTMFLDVHLMIMNPHNYIKQFADSGADQITFHVEAYNDEKKIVECLEMIKSFDIKCGLSLKPITKITELIKYLKIIDHILIMSVEPGFGGQKFMDSALIKLEELSVFKEKFNLTIAIDGGINKETFNKVKDTCLDFVVAGSYVFNSPDPAKAIKELK